MTAPARQRARKQSAEVRRETVLDAAIRVFARVPYRSAGTAEIAREAGIAEPTIYRHFSSKRELYLAAIERTSDSICEAWRGIIMRTHEAKAALEALGMWYVDSALANPDPLRLRFRATAEAEDDEVRTRLRDGYQKIVEMLAGVIAKGQEKGVVATEVDALAAAWLFCGIGQVYDLMILQGGDIMREPWCERISQVFDRALEPSHGSA